MNLLKTYERIVCEGYTYLLKKKLDATLKQAEQRLEQGTVRGDAFQDLLLTAQTLISNHQVSYPDFNANVEVPALADLHKLTIPAEPVNLKKYIVPAGLVTVGVISGLGAFAALVTLSYEGWMHLFKWIL